MVCTKCGFCGQISLGNNGFKSYMYFITHDFSKSNTPVYMVKLKEKLIQECFPKLFGHKVFFQKAFL